jgi:hypothetical protein
MFLTRIASLRLSLTTLFILSPLPSSATSPIAAPQPAFALVIGYNGTDDKDLEDLRYADDDAVNNSLLLSQYHVGVTLLTELDKESRVLYSSVKSSPPSLGQVHHAWETINAAMAKARQQGLRPVFYFFYSGHGDVKHNEGFLYLNKGKLWRSDLLKMLTESKAYANHVVIDSCKSFFMVFERGVGGFRRRVVGDFVQLEQKPPANTGFLLSTSAAENSHEWEAIQSGVFSHELRSALRGAGDLNRDNIITYQETAAFIWNANRSISIKRFRPSFFAWKPTDAKIEAQGLISLKKTKGDMLYFGPGFSQHYYIEDGKGIRLLDFHPARKQQVTIVLPHRRPLFLHQPKSNDEFSLPDSREIKLTAITWKKNQLAKRGAEHLEFKKMFEKPFKVDSLHEYKQSLSKDYLVNKPQPPSPWWRRSLALASPVFAAAGATMFILANHEQENVKEPANGTQVAEINERINTYHNLGLGFSITAGATIASYAIWTLFFKDDNNNYIFTNLFSPGAAMHLRY